MGPALWRDTVAAAIHGSNTRTHGALDGILRPNPHP